MYCRRKFRSQTSDNMDSWKSRGGQSQTGEEKKWEDQRKKSEKREDAGARKGRKVAIHLVGFASGRFSEYGMIVAYFFWGDTSERILASLGNRWKCFCLCPAFKPGSLWGSAFMKKPTVHRQLEQNKIFWLLSELFVSSELLSDCLSYCANSVLIVSGCCLVVRKFWLLVELLSDCSVSSSYCQNFLNVVRIFRYILLGVHSLQNFLIVVNSW